MPIYFNATNYQNTYIALKKIIFNYALYNNFEYDCCAMLYLCKLINKRKKIIKNTLPKNVIKFKKIFNKN